MIGLSRVSAEVKDFPLDALAATGRAEMLEVAELFYFYLETREPENGPRDFIRCVAEKDVSGKRDVVGSDDHSRGLALMQFLPRETPCKFIRKAGQPCPVENALEKRRHGRPPGRVENDEVFAPAYVLLERFEVGFQFLDAPVAVPEYRVEAHLAQIHPPYFVTRFLRAALILIGKRPVEAVIVRVAQKNENLFHCRRSF